jgi:hypothetical protein
MNKDEFDKLRAYAFSEANPGWKPAVQEAPNGDGKWDLNKRFAHLAPKYFNESTPQFVLDHWADGMRTAERVSRQLGIPAAMMPGPDSTLRILEYPPGAVSAEHTDFDLFTLRIYRNLESPFKYLGWGGRVLADARKDFEGIHFGEIMAVLSERFLATKHKVTATPGEWQYAAVFFAVPPWAAKLPSGKTVHEWMTERLASS